jgi:catechol 2,3-dioxygenase-like lactoylglutathione lyase family enzyme
MAIDHRSISQAHGCTSAETSVTMASYTGSGLAEYLGDRALEQGTGNLDHIVFLATDLPETYARLKSAGVDFRERTVPSLDLHQVFLEDPSGVTIELNFTAEEAIAASTKRVGMEGRAAADTAE